MKRLGLAVVLLVLSGGDQVSADVVTSTSGFKNPIIVDFSQFSGGWDYFGTTGPVQIGDLVGEDIKWSSSNPGSVIGDMGYGLRNNGEWGAGRNGYTGSNDFDGDGHSMLFSFDSVPVSGVAGFVNYAPHPEYGAFYMEALGNVGQVLESVNISASFPIDTPPDSVNQGAVRGFRRTENDIYALQLRGGMNVLDDLTFEPIPEPSTLLLFSIGATGLLLFARRRRRTEF